MSIIYERSDICLMLSILTFCCKCFVLALFPLPGILVLVGASVVGNFPFWSRIGSFFLVNSALLNLDEYGRFFPVKVLNSEDVNCGTLSLTNCAGTTDWENRLCNIAMVYTALVSVFNKK